MQGSSKGDRNMKTGMAFNALALFASAFIFAAAQAADTDKYTKEEFKADVKSAAKEAKDAAVDVGHQVATGSKKAYNSAKTKIKQDTKSGKPGDGSLAKKNDKQPVATPGHN
jgi:outer membrane lipoprotein-sorting protein